MKQIIVALEFDDEELGPQWMNHDNLKALLYSETKTKKKLLKVLEYQEHIGVEDCLLIARPNDPDPNFQMLPPMRGYAVVPLESYAAYAETASKIVKDIYLRYSPRFRHVKEKEPTSCPHR